MTQAPSATSTTSAPSASSATTGSGAAASGASAASMTGTRCLTVVSGPRRYDVVVDEFLLVADVLELVLPGVPLRAVSMAGEPLALASTLVEAGLETGSMIVTSPVGLELGSPVVHTDDVAPTWSPAAGTSASRAGSRSVLGTGDDGDEALAALAAGGALSPSSAGGRHASTTSPLPASRRARQRPRQAATVVAGAARRAGLLVGAVTGAILAVAAFSRATPPPALALALGVVLVGGGLAAAQATGNRLVPALSPVLGLAAGWVGLAGYVDDVRLRLVGACAAAALVALAGRDTQGVDRHVPRVWVVTSGAVGVAVLVATSVGAPLTAAAVLLVAAATLVSRVVPDLVFDVADDVLLDIDRLSVTSWSPREARRPLRRGWHIDADAVHALVQAGAVQGLTTHLAVLVVVTLGSATVLVAQLARPVAASTLVMTGAAVALVLLARKHRRRLDRWLVRGAALGPALAVALPWLLTLTTGWAVGVAVGAVLAALVAAALSGVVASGYRSLWAARVADAVEALALVAVLPLALWAGGLVTWATSLLA